MSGVTITSNQHGKARVRVAKVRRNKNGVHDIMEMNVQLLLQGSCMISSFTEGDNSNIIPTDTCKNSVYFLAKTNNFDSIEEFGQIIVKYFLNTYTDIVNKVSVEIVRTKWERIAGETAGGRAMDHKHAFVRSTAGIPFCNVQGMCSGNGPQNRSGRAGSAIVVTMQGGFKGLSILKTTQSGFVNFHKCKLTTLPSDTDRFVGTSVDAEWSYDSRLLNRRIDYAALYYALEKTLVGTFTGPADTGVYSPSVQKTLYEMAHASLKNHPEIEKITLNMPNLHFLPFPLQEKFGIKNADCSGKPNIFFPIDEPHGSIKATVERSNRARL